MSDQVVSGFDIDSTGLGTVRSAWRWLMYGFRSDEASASQVDHARRFSGLDGLRALSVVAVLCYHALPELPNAGFLGVDVFFVLSGFLITSLVIDQVDRHRFSLRSFWDRRLRRIVPAVVIMILGISLVVIWLNPDIMHGLRRQVLGSLTFSYNWLDISSSTSYFDQFQPELFRNLWSLAVEMQFYLVWPLLLVPLLHLVHRKSTAIVVWVGAGVSVLVAALLFQPGQDPTRVYFGTDTHAFGLLLGAGLACFLATKPRWQMRDAAVVSKPFNALLVLVGLAALGGIVAAIYFLDDANSLVYPWGLLGASVLACVAVLAASINGSWFGRMLDIPPLRWVGERSYGVYLWHWPVAVIVAAVVPWPDATPAITRELITLGGSLTLSIVAAAVSYKFVETPIRQRGWLAMFRRWGTTLKTRLPAVLKGVFFAASVASLVACLVVAPVKSSTELLIEQGEQSSGPTVSGPALIPGPGQVFWPPIPGGISFRPLAMPDGKDILAIGDSVMLGCSDALKLQFPGIRVDAKVSRSFASGLGIVEGAASSDGLRPVVIFGLFTNGIVTTDGLNQLLATVGTRTTLVLVTAHADRRWIPPTNKAVRQFVKDHPSVLLADWDAAIKSHPKWLADDGVHPNIPGRDVYVQAIVDALRQKYKG